MSLAYCANDMGSLMIEENVVRAAGASYCMDEVEIVTNIEDAGFIPKRRDMHYEILGDPVFRERDVPRMLALGTARPDGDAPEPEECGTSGAQPGGEAAAPDTVGRETRVSGRVFRCWARVDRGPLVLTSI